MEIALGVVGFASWVGIGYATFSAPVPTRYFGVVCAICAIVVGAVKQAN